jgi:hypothetical protein
MADALLGKTEVDAVSQELVLGSMVQQQLIQSALLLPTVNNYSAPLGVDKLKIPRAGGFTVGNKTENTAVDAQVITYATDDLALDKHKVIQVLIEKFALKQSQVAVLSDIAARAGKALALQLDTDIITALEAVSTSAPDHAIAWASGSALTAADFLNARELLVDQYINPQECYVGISAAMEKAVLGINDFVQAQTYGNAQGLQQGVLGTIYGMKVIVHTGFADAKSIFYHPSHVAVAIQELVSYDMDKDLANLAERHSWDMIYGVKTLDSGKRGVLVGTASP